MIKRLLVFLLVIQAGAALAIAAGVYPLFASLLPAAPAWAVAGLLGLLAVLLVRLLISANNFFLSWRSRSAAPIIHALTPLRALRLFLREFGASLRTSSYDMLRPLGWQVSTPQRGLPVLLIHGYGCNSGYWRTMSRHLHAASISHYAIDLEPPGADIDAFAPQVHAAIERLCLATGSKQVIILAHSMGGLVARAYLRRHGHAHIARVITLGTPHHGTALANFGPGSNAAQMRRSSSWLGTLAENEANEANLQRELFCSIYSVHDNIIAPQNSSELPGARNLVFGAIGHVALGSHPDIVRCALEEIASTQQCDFV